MKFDDFVGKMKRIQSAYRTAKQAGNEEQIDTSLRPLDETQAFWFVPTSDIWLVDYQTVGVNDEASTFTPMVRASSVEEQRERPHVNPNLLLRSGSRFFSNSIKSNIRSRMQEGRYQTRKAYLTMSEGYHT